ncbi:MAG: SH3 domain-containing protein, partial [Ignavibacteriales bacterium]
ATYASGRYNLARHVQPAQFTPARSADMWATSTVNIRSGPTSGSSKVGRLQRGQPFQALAYANGGQWILVGDNGVGIGYVNAAYVTAGQHYAYGYGY